MGFRLIQDARWSFYRIGSNKTDGHGRCMYVSASDFPVLDEPAWSSAATLLFPVGPKIQTSGKRK